MHNAIRQSISFAIVCIGSVATALTGLSATAGMNSWTAIGAVVSEFAVDPSSPSTIYGLVKSNTVTKTVDGGRHWTDLLKLDFVVYALVIDPGSPATVYVGGGDAWDIDDSPLYKTVDGGAHWVAIPKNSNGRYVGRLAVAPSTSSTLYAADGDAVFKSVDGGSSWALRSSGLTGWTSTALAVDPTNANTVYVAQLVFVGSFMEVARIFKSTDGGGQWRDVAFPVPPDPGRTVIRALAIDPATPSIVYASYDTCTAGGCNGGGVYKSTDGGESWVLARNGMSGAGPVTALAIDPAAPARIYAGTAHGVFASDDRAASWTPINSGLTSLSVFGLSIDRTGSILRAATADGLFEYAFLEPSAFGTVQVIEYHHPAFDDYFITADPHEIRLLDDGAVTGWVRTGLHFNAYAASNANSVPVCRFLRTTLGPHFFTPFATECATTQTDAGWMLETTDAFDIALPAADGSCAEGFTRVYRLYNNGQGGAPAHRYTTDAGVRAEMIGQGWVAEGVGPQAVQMCSPP